LHTLYSNAPPVQPPSDPLLAQQINKIAKTPKYSSSTITPKCRFWNGISGSCKNTTQCPFQHVELCKNYSETANTCKFGSQCKFIHAGLPIPSRPIITRLPLIRPLVPLYPPLPTVHPIEVRCRFYNSNPAENKCKFGDKCLNHHPGVSNDLKAQDGHKRQYDQAAIDDFPHKKSKVDYPQAAYEAYQSYTSTYTNLYPTAYTPHSYGQDQSWYQTQPYVVDPLAYSQPHVGYQSR